MTSDAQTDIHAKFHIKRGAFSLNVDIHFPGTGITALFGESGSGKTTLLRYLAGLEQSKGGYLNVKGDIWQSDHTHRPTHKRNVGYVFQEASLFPHLTIEKNLLYGWKRTHKKNRKVAFDETVALLDLKPFLHRYSHQLSGGQRQRVAIARALLTSPQLLLMDEPLSNLDLQSKQEILPYLERLHDQLKIPVVYVSHAIDEVVKLADHLVLLEQGEVLASGDINQLLTRADLPLSKQEEACSVLSGIISSHEPQYHLSHISVNEIHDHSTVLLSQQALPVGHPVRVRVFARDVSLSLLPPQKTSISNVFTATVHSLFPASDPSQVMVKLNLGGQYILSRITKRSQALLHIEPEMRVYAQVKAVALIR